MSWEFPLDLGIPPHEIESRLESNLVSSRFFVCGLAVPSTSVSVAGLYFQLRVCRIHSEFALHVRMSRNETERGRAPHISEKCMKTNYAQQVLNPCKRPAHAQQPNVYLENGYGDFLMCPIVVRQCQGKTREEGGGEGRGRREEED